MDQESRQRGDQPNYIPDIIDLIVGRTSRVEYIVLEKRLIVLARHLFTKHTEMRRQLGTDVSGWAPKEETILGLNQAGMLCYGDEWVDLEVEWW